MNKPTMLILDQYDQLVCVLQADYIKDGVVEGDHSIIHDGSFKVKQYEEDN